MMLNRYVRFGRNRFVANGLVHKVLRFGIVGLLGAGVDLVVFGLLSYFYNDISLIPLWKLVSAHIAIINNFCLNRRWTFRGSGLNSRVGSWKILLVKYYCVSLLGVILSTVIIELCVVVVGIGRTFSNALAIVIVSILNFFFARKLFEGGRLRED